MRNNLNLFINSNHADEQEYILHEKSLVIVAGPETKIMSFKRGLDILARSLGAIKPIIREKITEFEFEYFFFFNSKFFSSKNLIYYFIF